MHTKFEHPRHNSSCYILPTRIVDDATYGQRHTIIRPSNDGRIKSKLEKATAMKLTDDSTFFPLTVTSNRSVSEKRTHKLIQ